MVAGPDFDVPGAKPADLSYLRLQVRPVRNRAGYSLSTPINISAVKEATHRGAI
jgi:hypothetical protein